jgi:phosphoenolpyruvate synthase/pyruvate phosphate dikinase
MFFISDKEADKAREFNIGGKARNLFLLKEMDMPVPPFAVIPWKALLAELPPDQWAAGFEEIRTAIERTHIPTEFINELTAVFKDAHYFAVRSSAPDEDGSAFSFAGQFESQLFVAKEKLAEQVKRVWCSAFSQRVSDYRNHHRLTGQAGMAVIVQEMIPADVSGVAFGANPVTGDRREKLINAVFGVGEGLVSGELNADQFILKGTAITSALAAKTHRMVFDEQKGGGLMLEKTLPQQQSRPTLSQREILRLGEILDALHTRLGKPQDIEFAICNQALFLLQTRPITTLSPHNDQSGEYILWDNSNIIESYPGVTTPLTFSFISQSYEVAYKLFSAYLGVSSKTIKQHERVFANTLGFINGRVYYNLKTWYHMLAMLPGYSVNARFMEKMMGVKEQFDIPDTYRLSKGNAWWSIAKMAVRMFVRFLSLPRQRKAFTDLLNQTIGRYKAIDFAEKNAGELMQLYIEFEKKLLLEWKAPLLNDFFAMIWFGMLQKLCGQYLGETEPNIHNDLLCGSSDIISVEPVHRSIQLASRITDLPELKNLFVSQREQAIWRELQTNTLQDYQTVKKDIEQYIHDFGERCIGELKLETVSYTQDPTKFVRILKSYVETGIKTDQLSRRKENEIRENAEKLVDLKLKGDLFRKWKLKQTINKARELVSARENLRYERTRAFGIVREIFSAIGKRFYADGMIASERDIFFLTKQEIFNYIEGTAVTQNIRALIALRRQEFESFKMQEAPSERFATYGPPYHANDFFNTDRIEKHEGALRGIGCSPGRVTGRVRVVLDASETSSLNGDILVTSSTDPGWVTLFPSASGIIVERGSLLSHSAIVSREMGKPCIVSVTGLLKTLKTGDEIEMDGSMGTIRIISQ